MFATNDEDTKLQASVLAVDQTKLWESVLSTRIALQKSLDIANSLPLHFNPDDSISAPIENIIFDLVDALDSQNSLIEERSQSSLKEKSKRKLQIQQLESREKEEEIWNHISSSQKKLKPSWEHSVDKWYARLLLGSNSSKSNLKVFNQSIWSQAENFIQDESTAISKSRSLFTDSKRKDKFTNRPTSLSEYDEEIYEDRQFYSMLLRSFISSYSSSSSSETTVLLEARKSNKKNKVDRKASKGRRLRFKSHPKLENYMFPTPQVSSQSMKVRVDVDKLQSSLFQ